LRKKRLGGFEHPHLRFRPLLFLFLMSQLRHDA
jgi:hypothetical protein